MNKQALKKSLNDIDQLFSELTREIYGNEVVDGNPPTPARQKERSRCELFCWSAKLSTICEMLSAQDWNPTRKQEKYLRGIMLGGMGSLLDLYISEDAVGEAAAKARRKLDKKLDKLFEVMSKK